MSTLSNGDVTMIRSSTQAMERVLRNFYKKGERSSTGGDDRHLRFALVVGGRTWPRWQRALAGSWKNVISLGDGPAERRALQESLGESLPRRAAVRVWDSRLFVRVGRSKAGIGFQHLNPASPRTGTIKSFRTKTVPWRESPVWAGVEPCCYELIAELQMISAWLSALSFLDEDFDVDLNEGEEALMKIHNMMMDVEARFSLRNTTRHRRHRGWRRRTRPTAPRTPVGATQREAESGVTAACSDWELFDCNPFHAFEIF
ncbi:Uncharacterized protein SCF082_LOCUS33079 [Durusdinium trenchii]|uniref:Uncharacterized protein n=1 Tax=Durusdinium trenchii TaxID=1381693 RepID=A0ABP0NKY7_9DINO